MVQARPQRPVGTVPGHVESLSGWGNFPRGDSAIVEAADPREAAALVTAGEGIVARGAGRAYGDAAIGLRTTLLTGRLDRLRGFDPETGLLRAEAGARLSDIIATFLPRGYFPPVVPGTGAVTLGGMIAADVHGKNHHRDGSFAGHVESLTIAVPEGEVLVCTRTQNPTLFALTLGGMGLTGTVLEATLRLARVESGWIRQETRVADDLSAMLRALEAAADATYAVAWVDCLAQGQALGRGLVYLGEHADAASCAGAGLDLLPAPPRGGIAVPPGLPAWTLNRASVKAFNSLYFHRGAAGAGQPALVPWHSYFFPLDGLSDWYRLYGRRGFVQHQCVVPAERAAATLGAILERVARLGGASPLAVLKQLGPARGGLSFPMPGYTLALDMPASPAALALLDELDRLVVGAGGRLYLAKDARQSRATFEAGYADADAFRDLRRGLGANRRIASRLSTRLGI